MTARQFGDVPVQGMGRGYESVREVLAQRPFVEFACDTRMPEQRTQLGRKCEESWPGRVVQRFLAEAVPREKELPPRAVVDGEGEHAVQHERQIAAPLLVSVYQDLGVGMVRSEDVA